MQRSIEIRPATAGDAQVVGNIVRRGLRETKARDYPAHVIDRLAASLRERIAAHLQIWLRSSPVWTTPLLVRQA